MRLKRIAVVGLGLIGGSLAAACRRAFPGARIVGVSRSGIALARARAKRWIHEGTKDLKEGIDGADLVILCTPVDTLKSLLLQIDRSVASKVVVTDAGSVKGFLVRWADRRRWKRVSFVGAHPMAGSHLRGIHAAEPDLFEEAFTFVTPGRRTSRGELRLVKSFWSKISRRVVVVSPERHDELTAEISHLPHLLAALLVASSRQASLRFAAPGFLDTTRLAQGEPGLWVPIFLENRTELFRTVKHFQETLRRTVGVLRRGNAQALGRLLRECQRRRAALE